MTGRVLFADVGNTAVKWRLWTGSEWGDACWMEPEKAVQKAGCLLDKWRPGTLVAVASVSMRTAQDGYPVYRHGARQPQSEETPRNIMVVAAALAETADQARIPCLLAGCDFAIPIQTAYHDPNEVGLDRLCSAFAASNLVGKPVVTASAGTCLTVEAVDARGVLVGGAIAAGVGAMAHGISEGAPHLRPFVEDALRADATTLVLGRSTFENIALGLWLGAAAVLDRLIAAARAVVGPGAPVVLTGGDAHKIAPLCQTQVDVVDYLVLEGLRLAYQSHLARSLGQ